MEGGTIRWLRRESQRMGNGSTSSGHTEAERANGGALLAAERGSALAVVENADDSMRYTILESG